MIQRKHRRLFSEAERRAHRAYIAGLCEAEEVARLRGFAHHRAVNRYDHALLVSYLSCALARRWGWDAAAAARAGLLHDLFFTACDGTWELCMHHPETACANAEALTGGLTAKERNIILSHMWPAGRYLPHCREAWLVDIVDTLVTVMDLCGKSGKYSRWIDREPGAETGEE